MNLIKRIILFSKLKIQGEQLFNYTFIALRVFLLKPNIIYMGDSHAHFLAGGGKKRKKFSLWKGNRLVIWLGPVLMYTISKNGFNFDKRVRMVLNLAGSKRRIVLLVGEIDCRVHFVQKNLDLGTESFDKIALGYKKSVMKLIKDFDLLDAVIMTPLPPSNLRSDELKFSRIGSIAERVLVTKMITKSLEDTSSFKFIVLNYFSALSNRTGIIKKEFTDDGVHLNSIGLKKLISEFDFEKAKPIKNKMRPQGFEPRTF